MDASNRQKKKYSSTYRTLLAQYPHHTASGRREMRARESRSPGAQKDNDKPDGVDLTSYLPPEPTLHDSQLSFEHPRSAVKDFQHSTITGPVSRFSRPQSPATAAFTKSSVMSQTLSELSGSDVDSTLLAGQSTGPQQNRSSLQIPLRIRYALTSYVLIAFVRVAHRIIAVRPTTQTPASIRSTPVGTTHHGCSLSGWHTTIRLSRYLSQVHPRR